MKKFTVIILVMGALIFSSCQQSKKDDPEKLKAVLTGYFDAIKTKDFQKMKDLSTENFVLFEDGKVFNNDSLIKFISGMPFAKADYRFDNSLLMLIKIPGI